MRFIPGAVVGLVMAVAFLAYRSFGPSEPVPDRAFLELELAAADEAATGTCFSLNTVLIANTVGYSKAVISWHRVDADTWTRRSEEMVQGPRGPSHVWRSHTFQRENDRILLIAHDSAPGPVGTLKVAVDALLEAPRDRQSTRIDRCLNGGTGYAPKS